MSRLLYSHLTSLFRDYFNCFDVRGCPMWQLMDETGIPYQGFREILDKEYGDIFDDRFKDKDIETLMLDINRASGSRPEAGFAFLVIGFDLNGEHHIRKIPAEDIDPYAYYDMWNYKFEVDGAKIEIVGGRDDDLDRILPIPYNAEVHFPDGTCERDLRFTTQIVFGHFEDLDEYCGRIEAAGSPDALRDILMELEDLIKSRCSLPPYGNECPNECGNFDVEEIYEMLSLRARILNKMFLFSEEEVRLLKEKNTELEEKSDIVRERAEALMRGCFSQTRDRSFDLNLSVDARLYAYIPAGWDAEEECWNNVREFESDSFYGSDFRVMMPLVQNIGKSMEYLCGDLFNRTMSAWDLQTIETVEELEENTEYDCHEYTFLHWGVDNPLLAPALAGIGFCNAAYAACNNLPFSLTDFIRIRHFNMEVSLVSKKRDDYRYWMEACPSIEYLCERYGGMQIPNNEVESLLKKSVFPSNNRFHYEREFGEGEHTVSRRMTVFTFRDEYSQDSLISAIDRKFGITDRFNTDDASPDHIKTAIDTVAYIRECHTGKGLEALTPFMRRNLERSLAILEQHGNDEEAVLFAASAEQMLRTLPLLQLKSI